MDYLIGVVLALATGVFGTVFGFDRERGFYPVVLVVIASYYALFAVMGGAMGALAVEVGIMVGFVALAVVGFRRAPWLVVAALAGHGVLDMVHPHLVTNPGVPAWWPVFCMAFDVVAAGYLAVRLLQARRTSGPSG